MVLYQTSLLDPVNAKAILLFVREGEAEYLIYLEDQWIVDLTICGVSQHNHLPLVHWLSDPRLVPRPFFGWRGWVRASAQGWLGRFDSDSALPATEAPGYEADPTLSYGRSSNFTCIELGNNFRPKVNILVYKRGHLGIAHLLQLAVIHGI